MLYPTISELTKDEFNRYELALATAKCARVITDEYVKQREAAEKAATGNKEADRNLINMINKEYRDEKAVKNAITRINSGEYKIVRIEATEEIAAEAEETDAVAETDAESSINFKISFQRKRRGEYGRICRTSYSEKSLSHR